MKTISKKTAPIAMQDLKAANHFISGQAAASMTKKYKVFRNKLNRAKPILPFPVPGLPVAISYKKEAIRHLMAQKGCTAIRVYPAINRHNELTLVFVGINAKGDNILTPGSGHESLKGMAASNSLVVDEGQMSPPYPATAL